MLSLVSYGSSGESDDEDNSDKTSISSNDINTVSNSKTSENQVDNFNDKEWNEDSVQIAKENHDINDLQPLKEEYEIPKGKDVNVKENSLAKDDLLSKLPPPVSDLRNIPWDQLSKLTYKSRAIRIMAPSIPEDVEEKKEKKLPSKSGSGLLAMLPKPRHEFLATPSVLKPRSVTKKPSTPAPKTIAKPKLLSVKKTEENDSDSGGEMDGDTDFFSLSSAPAIPDTKLKGNSGGISLSSEIPLPSELSFTNAYEEREIPISITPSSGPSESSSHFSSHEEDSPFVGDADGDINYQSSHSSHDYMSLQQSNDELQLDSEALAALCGSRGLKRRAGSGNDLKVIDIKGSQLTPDAQELLSKNLTADQPRPKKNNKDGPTSQQKRKHQIIYLAHQAKELELELQNTWSNNRMTKKQTQAKYGF